MVFMRLSMRKIEETLILCRSIMVLTTRKAARCCGIARSTLAEYLAHVERAGLFRPSQKNSMIFLVEPALSNHYTLCLQRRKP